MQTATQASPVRRGLAAASSAYLVWGLFPLWTALRAVPVLQVLAHRAVWCALVVWLFLVVRRDAGWFRGMPAKLFWLLVASALTISVNWGLYIYAVTSGHVLDTSLGYFITPLVSMICGVLFFRERMNVLQWAAALIAAAGVVYLAFNADHLPWIALVLACSFGTYGLIRKVAVVEPIHGLAMESTVMFPLAAAYLLWVAGKGTGAFAHQPLRADAMLVAGGVVTAVPLALFAYGARRVPMTMLGFLQYFAPTLQLLLGVFVYGEPFGRVQTIAFGCIWAAVALYSFDGLRQYLRAGRTAPTVARTSTR